MKNIYKVEILRYGSEELGYYFYGIFDDREKAIESCKEYNEYRGGKYPEILLYTIPLNEGIPFQEINSEKINVEKIKRSGWHRFPAR